ncbi:hypothetical protein DPMN_056244 [Dreissena polymorpha]|uniref:Uncharacterized protein n=1 Tax=Dreissena polymorpha TaxID=45954 RepID=A0A9D4CS69_DREPO|nr:hypothetical protein DPMN_056244 [Dreissena polymorpha]
MPAGRHAFRQAGIQAGSKPANQPTWQKERHRDGQTNTQADGRTDRQTDISETYVKPKMLENYNDLIVVKLDMYTHIIPPDPRRVNKKGRK